MTMVLGLVLAACADNRDDEAQGNAGTVPAPGSAIVAPSPPAPETTQAAAVPSSADAASIAIFPDEEPGSEQPSPWLVPVAPAARMRLTPDGLGPVRLGMTLGDARKALDGATLTRGWDGDGVAYVNVARDGIDLMSLHADEDDPDAGIDWSRRITYIQSFSAVAATVDGVAVGDLVADAAKKWGPVSEISLSEIESRQHVRFARQPEWLSIRIDYSGDFPEGSRSTTRYEPGARIMSFAIVERVRDEDE